MINNYTKLILFLLVPGLLIFVLRVMLQSDDAVPTGDSVWQISMSATISREQSKQALHVSIPKESPNIRILAQSLHHPGFKIRHAPPAKSLQREIVASPVINEELTFTAEYNIHISHNKHRAQETIIPKPLTPEQRLRYLALSDDENREGTKFEKTLTKLRSQSDNSRSLINEIFKFVNHNILNVPLSGYKSEDDTLRTNRANAFGKAKLMVALCRASNIPARLASGIIVKEMIDIDQHYWVEVYDNEQWISYDPTLGMAEEVAINYLKLNAGSETLAYLDDGTEIKLSIDSVQQPTTAGVIGTGKKRFFDIFDLNRLPVSTRFMLATLLMLPIGALITTIFRNLIGVFSYGTFTPSLIAMAIIHAEWFTVVVVAAIAVAIGIGGRSIFPEKMNRAPRLSIILTIVAISMVMIISGMEYYDFNPDAEVVLLPIIVLANLVDRFYTTADERGLVSAIYRLAWTCVITLICVSLFTIETLQQFVVSYPEIHFLVLFGILSINSYKGPKLCAHPYCQWLVDPGKEKSAANPE